jgi:hypothetical protein
MIVLFFYLLRLTGLLLFFYCSAAFLAFKAGIFIYYQYVILTCGFAHTLLFNNKQLKQRFCLSIHKLILFGLP